MKLSEAQREYVKAKPKWPWRDFLTADEKKTLEQAEKAKAEWLRLNLARASITNRAIQRAKYAGRQALQED